MGKGSPKHGSTGKPSGNAHQRRKVRRADKKAAWKAAQKEKKTK